MKKIAFEIFILLLLPSAMWSQKKEDTFRVFYLGGQSNMDGYGYNSELPDSLKTGYDRVFIFHGNPVSDEMENGGTGIWQKLEPGHGRGFSSDGETNELSDRFGVELSFARRMQYLYPDEKIAIIKYSRGGTTIDSIGTTGSGAWEPDFRGKTGINQYDHFLRTLTLAMETDDIDGNGQPDRLIPGGIIWMQGESDAHQEEVAKRYYNNLKRLMDLFRAAFRVDDLPVVLGKISDSWDNEKGKVWEFGELVQYAQEKFVMTDVNAAIVRDTRYYEYSDRWHYNSEGYIDLGTRFADAVYQLNQEK